MPRKVYRPEDYIKGASRLRKSLNISYEEEADWFAYYNKVGRAFEEMGLSREEAFRNTRIMFEKGVRPNFEELMARGFEPVSVKPPPSGPDLRLLRRGLITPDEFRRRVQSYPNVLRFRIRGMRGLFSPRRAAQIYFQRFAMPFPL